MALRRLFRKPAAPESDERIVAPEFEVVVFAEDGRVTGTLRLYAPRLTDGLAAGRGLDLVNALVQPLSGASVFGLAQVHVDANELLLVAGSGPRGDAHRRVHTTAHPVTVRMEPYRVSGYIHAPRPVLDPVERVRHRNAMVPLTDTFVEYRVGESQIRESFPVVIVNRVLATAFEPGQFL